MATDDKYDRQLRLWGGHGQRLLANSAVLLINATSAATETLKNLILPAVGRFTIADEHKVTERDCGNNFFVTRESIGQRYRAEVTCELLKELNPDVEGDCIIDAAANVIANVKFLQKYQLIIASDLDNVRKPMTRINQKHRMPSWRWGTSAKTMTSD
jgi:NEDD8-activating enzyme E1 regulatory subunit